MNIEKEMKARILKWHLELMPFILALDEEDRWLSVPVVNAAYEAELTEECRKKVHEATIDLEPWLTSLDPKGGGYVMFFDTYAEVCTTDDGLSFELVR